MKTKEELNSLKEEVETMNKKLHELTDEELKQVVGGGVMDIGKVSPIEGLSSLSLTDMVAEQEKHGLGTLGGSVATPGGGASQLINEGRMGIDPRSEQVANPSSLRSNVDIIK